MAAALAAAGVLIILSSRLDRGQQGDVRLPSAILIGAVQALCLPFRGFLARVPPFPQVCFGSFPSESRRV